MWNVLSKMNGVDGDLASDSTSGECDGSAAVSGRVALVMIASVAVVARELLGENVVDFATLVVAAAADVDCGEANDRLKELAERDAQVDTDVVDVAVAAAEVVVVVAAAEVVVVAAAAAAVGDYDETGATSDDCCSI